MFSFLCICESFFSLNPSVLVYDNRNVLGFMFLVLHAKAIQSILNALEENGCENVSLPGHMHCGFCFLTRVLIVVVRLPLRASNRKAVKAFRSLWSVTIVTVRS